MLTLFTIVLDGMPWISLHWPELRKLPASVPWRWIVVEGVAAPANCTSWCQPMEPRVSRDGTHGYLRGLAAHDHRVTHIWQPVWTAGKVQMCNAAAKWALDGVLWQVDSDELWTAAQWQTGYDLLLHAPGQPYPALSFWCDYFLGPDIVITGHGHYGNNDGYEWYRAWRWERGMRFTKHEPPTLDRPVSYMPQRESANFKLRFKHMAYTAEAQLALKERYYGYKDAVAHWRRLQANTKWPARVGDFLPWVKDGAMCDKVSQG